MSEEMEQQEQVSETKKNTGGISWFKLGFYLILIVAVLGGGYYLIKNKGFSGLADVVSSVSSGPVATVNGEKITKADYDKLYARYESTITAQGQSATSTESQNQIKELVLNDLIAETLVFQKAAENNITASTEEVDEIFNQNKSQFESEEAFNEALAAEGFDAKSFKSEIADQIVVRKYLESQIDLSTITVSDEEIQALYDQVTAGAEDAPELELLSAQIEQQIMQQKQQALVQQFISSLRESSEIEILI